MNSKYKIVLSSHSPRRRELLSGLDVDFTIRVIQDIDETYPGDLAVAEIPQYLSRKKAEAYLPTLADDELLITADTVVVVGDEVLGKPSCRDEAVAMLHQLSNRSHQVITGVSLTTRTKQRSFNVTTHVTFKELTDDEIAYYVDKYQPFDKAGAYGIQEWIGYIGVTSLEGSYFNVMGLPVQRIYTELQNF
ncbi:MAG: septum formation protein Maf [Prevotella sp.]|nr:septum formation protein Maf [Prevotella sp.]